MPAIRFKDLSEREILALAMSSEADDARTSGELAEEPRADFPATAELFKKMQAEELTHHRRLSELYRGRFGDHIAAIGISLNRLASIPSPMKARLISCPSP